MCCLLIPGFWCSCPKRKQQSSSIRLSPFHNESPGYSFFPNETQQTWTKTVLSAMTSLFSFELRLPSFTCSRGIPILQPFKLLGLSAFLALLSFSCGHFAKHIFKHFLLRDKASVHLGCCYAKINTVVPRNPWPHSLATQSCVAHVTA